LLENISSFHGVSHRIEYIKTINGVAYYNDSKATNIDSTLVALKSFKCGINLIVGGSDKGYEFNKLFENLPNNVLNIVAIGETAEKIMKAANKCKFKSIIMVHNLKEALVLLAGNAKNGEIVLLSPACASFDQFKNYEERGSVFKKLVEELPNYENDNTLTKKNL